LITRIFARLPLIQRALRLVWVSARGWTTASIGLVIVQAALPLLALYLIKLLFDAISAALAAPEAGGHAEQIGLLIVLAGAVAVVQALAAALAGWVSTAQANAVTDHVHDVLHIQSVALDLSFYEQAQYYERLHRAQEEAPYRPARIVNSLMQMAQNGVSLVAVVGLLLSIHWGVIVLLLAAAVPGVIVRLAFARQSFRWLRRQTPHERRAWYYDWMLIDGGHAKEIRLFELGPLFIRRYRELRTHLRRERSGVAARRALVDVITASSLVLAVFGSFALIAGRALAGLITLGDLVMYFQAFQRAQTMLQDLLRALANLYEDGLFLSYLGEFLALTPQLTDGSPPAPMPTTFREGVVFEGVAFQYPGVDQPTLRAIDLVLRPGETIALVGENGQGKTTLIKLLCRLYDPTAGRITLDGIDLRQFRVADLRRQIGVVFQDYVHYNLTAAENIGLGAVDAASDHERIAEAARQSGVDRVIEALPQGYETLLGKLFEDGAELSIGQWQKIALARAFMRRAPIVVLDEPTSALDAQAEFELFEQFRQLMRGRSAILISHRLSTVRMADRIYVLDDGHIIESGTHDELIARRGKYAHLFELQAQAYR
jgi:ATP-binding cassette subfamily B protein